jgi:glyoxylase-like metal-dependent hydrolase (beta-lactamase superfamily II)
MVEATERMDMDVQVVQVAAGVWHARAKHVGWVLVSEGSEISLIDTGYPGDRDRVIASLEQIGHKPSDVAAVVLTHAHPDHLGSAEYFRTEHSIRILAHDDEVANAIGSRLEQLSTAAILRRAWRPDVLVWARDVLSLKAERVERLSAVDTFTAETLDVPGDLVPVHAPGHTSGHCAFHLPHRGVLVAGDALMTEHALVRVAGPQLLPDFFNRDTELARASLHALSGLAADVVVPGHGPAFSGTPAAAVSLALRTDSARRPLAPHCPIVIRYGATLPVPPTEAFAFVAYPPNWPKFFEGIQSVRSDDDWASIGGHAHVTTAFLGRSVASRMEITVWDPPRELRYVARQAGAPDLDNRRVFEPVPNGTRLRGSTAMLPRRGARSLVDRGQILVLRRMYAKAMSRLPAAMGATHS